MTARNRGLAGRSPQQVQSLLVQSFTQSAIAAQVGVTKQAVSCFVRRHSLTRNSPVERVVARQVQVLRMVKDGYKSAEIATRLGVSVLTISHDRKALGIPGFPKPKPAEHRTLCGLTRDHVQARLEQVNRAQLGRELGVSSSAVYSYCRRARLCKTMAGPDNPSNARPTFRL